MTDCQEIWKIICFNLIDTKYYIAVIMQMEIHFISVAVSFRHLEVSFTNIQMVFFHVSKGTIKQFKFCSFWI